MSLNDSVAYINGLVYTIQPSMRWISAFIVSPEGVFTNVGTTEEIVLIAKQHQLVIVDLKGRFAMPGIHDAHMHLLISGLGLTSGASIDFNTTHLNIAENVKRGSCACEYINVYQDWILAGAYNNDNFPDMKADRQYLDKMFPNRPVIVQGGAGHSMLLNTAALERAGYDLENEPDALGAKFYRRPDGSLTGELGENAVTKAALSVPRPGRAHIKRILKHAVQIAHRAGVTSTQEASSNTLLLEALSEMEKEGSLNMDISTHIVYGPEWLACEKKESLVRLLDTAEQFKSKHVDTRFVKIILDGVPLPPLFTHAAFDDHGHVNLTNIQVEDIADAVLEYDKRGMTIKIHCTGQGATRMALDAIESARKQNPGGPRHEIAHNSGVHHDDFPRYAPLNVTAEMSPAMFFVHPVTASSNGLMNWNFTQMLNHNAHMTIGSDWGAAPDPSLFESLDHIVEVVGRGIRSKGAEQICRMLTINGAVAVGRENEVGSIEVGKKANFIVVNRDLSKGEFAGAKVVRTYFEGVKVWDADI